MDESVSIPIYINFNDAERPWNVLCLLRVAAIFLSRFKYETKTVSDYDRNAMEQEQQLKYNTV